MKKADKNKLQRTAVYFGVILKMPYHEFTMWVASDNFKEEIMEPIKKINCLDGHEEEKTKEIFEKLEKETEGKPFEEKIKRLKHLLNALDKEKKKAEGK